MTATVRLWHDDEGWGVLDAPKCPGGCWAHFSSAAVTGVVRFTPGELVELEWEPAEQDGFSYRAVRFWPADRQPVDRPTSSSDPGGAYSSTLTLTFDPPDSKDRDQQASR